MEEYHKIQTLFKRDEKTKKLIEGEFTDKTVEFIKDLKWQFTDKKIWELYLKGYSINKISKELKYDWGQVKLRLKEIYDNPELLKEEL